MRRKLFAPTVVFALLVASVWLPCESARAQLRSRLRRVNPTPTQGRTPRGSSPTSGQNARLQAIAEDYLKGYFAFNPSAATALGLHQYDTALESRSRDAVAREVRRLNAALADLSRIREWMLSTEARFDYLVLQSHARAQLLELEEIRTWQRDPNVYNRIAAESIDNILKRNYAPTEQRLDAVLARERQIARLLEEARSNLDAPPRIYTETAIQQARGSLDYFARVVPQMIERAGGGRLSASRRAEINATNESVLAALRSFIEWLERDLLPRSTGDFSIGTENFRRKLLYEEMVETPPAQLIREGEKELRRTQDEMRALAEEIAPGRGVLSALELLGREHPTADGLVGETRRELDRIRAFVRVKEILTPPASENLSVAETPEYARSTSFASMDTPGAFERVATEAYYYVTPPDPAWDARRTQEHLSFYNAYALPVISIHEVYPGHYYQLLAARNSPSRVRAALGSASFIEGWAHYCEQMMLDEGFGGNNPKLRLAQLQLALLRLCRYLVGLRMHTQGMSYEEGVEFFMREGYQQRVNAEREARRGTMDPTYLVYTLGKMEILKLREEWRRQMGTSFRLGDFHDRLLSYGSPPVRVARMALLGDAGRASTSSVNNRGASSPSSSTEIPVNEFSQIDFSVLATGTMSGYEGGRTAQMISSAEEWQRAWRIIGGERPLPEVNFNTRSVLVVYQGQRPTGGYSISIEEIRRVGTVLAVFLNERRPASGDITTQVITSPFVAVSIPRPPAGTTVSIAEPVEDGRTSAGEKPPIRKKTVTPRTRRSRRRGLRRP
ncbi:MAG TPA: DUF885 family protein [Pyrinomonadaceae bacterium]|jgi:uncharacterized protein (DUF885 family)